MWIKQLCYRKVRDFASALRARKVFGALEKWAPGLHFTESKGKMVTPYLLPSSVKDTILHKELTHVGFFFQQNNLFKNLLSWRQHC